MVRITVARTGNMEQLLVDSQHNSVRKTLNTNCSLNVNTICAVSSEVRIPVFSLLEAKNGDYTINTQEILQAASRIAAVQSNTVVIQPREPQVPLKQQVTKPERATTELLNAAPVQAEAFIATTNESNEEHTQYTTPSNFESMPINDVWILYKENPDNSIIRNRLIEEYMPIVQYQASMQYATMPDRVDKDDFISEGIFGLMDSLSGYDVSRGVKFETYCVRRIRGAMMDYLRRNDRVPRLLRSKIKKKTVAEAALRARLAREPSELEIAAEMGITIAEYQALITDAVGIKVESIHRPLYETDTFKEVNPTDVLEDHSVITPELKELKNDLWKTALANLSQIGKIIILLYYREGKSMKEIGKSLNLSESRVSQIHATVIHSLKEQCNNDSDSNMLLAYLRDEEVIHTKVTAL